MTDFVRASPGQIGCNGVFPRRAKWQPFDPLPSSKWRLGPEWLAPAPGRGGPKSRTTPRPPSGAIPARRKAEFPAASKRAEAVSTAMQRADQVLCLLIEVPGVGRSVSGSLIEVGRRSSRASPRVPEFGRSRCRRRMRHDARSYLLTEELRALRSVTRSLRTAATAAVS
jgi:hypothetical protein